jgi:hypothetical protein
VRPRRDRLEYGESRCRRRSRRIRGLSRSRKQSPPKQDRPPTRRTLLLAKRRGGASRPLSLRHGEAEVCRAHAETRAGRPFRSCARMGFGRSLGHEAVAQSPGGLTGAFLRAGLKKPQVVAHPRPGLPSVGAASPLSGHHSACSPGFRRRLCATASQGKASILRARARTTACRPGYQGARAWGYGRRQGAPHERPVDP